MPITTHIRRLHWHFTCSALLALSLIALSFAAAPPASQPADLTIGFTLQPLHFEVQHPYDLKLEDRYSYDKPTDTHDLWVLATDKPHAPPPNKTEPRTEIRIEDDNYKPGSGLHMMNCDMYIVPGTFACISQVFGTGPMTIILVDKNGAISDLASHTLIAKDMVGKWFNWKIIHDPSASGKNAIKVYINNQLAASLPARTQRSFYFKVGVYSRKNSTRNEVKIRNLQYWIKPPADKNPK